MEKEKGDGHSWIERYSIVHIRIPESVTVFSDASPAVFRRSLNLISTWKSYQTQ